MFLLQRPWAKDFLGEARTELTRIGESPVAPTGDPGDGDEGRILEPTVMLDGATWKLWYSGNAANTGGHGQDWDVFYATSADGITWTKLMHLKP